MADNRCIAGFYVQSNGAWTCPGVPDGVYSVLFATGYDYAPGWGRALDAVLMRRIIGWMTAWSFDRLRGITVVTSLVIATSR